MDIRKVNNGINIQKYEDRNKDNMGIGNKKDSNDGKFMKMADKISISGEAKKSSITDVAINKIKSDSQKEFSIEKFNVLKEKIKNGEYNVSSDKIAQAIFAGIIND